MVSNSTDRETRTDELREKLAMTDQVRGREVSVHGWIGKVRNLGKLVFFELQYGAETQQVVVKDQIQIRKFIQLKSGDLITVTGTFKQQKQKGLEATKSEILLASFQIVNETTPLPFEIKDDLQLKEDNRYRYRYLDLRRSESRKIITIKHELLHFIRNFFYQQSFTEIETPILSQNSPEGARTFVVESNTKGKFYTLPQSPQIFKQILMVGGFEKYYQIAKTFRNEDARSNRQLEFLQLDLEVSFPNQKQLLGMVEEMMRKILEEIFEVQANKISFQQLSYGACMEKYGSDKPDLRNSLSITKFPFRIISQRGTLASERSIFAKERIATAKLQELDSLFTNERGDLCDWVIFSKETTSIQISSQGPSSQLNDELQAKLENGWYVTVSGAETFVNSLLAKVRTILGREEVLTNSGQYKFLWITDWPLFEHDSETGKLIALRHPFTMPKETELTKLNGTKEEQATVLTDSYDLVCNGEELASGSLRIYKKELQEKVFKILGFNAAEADKHFGYFLRALAFAAPPHGGIGIGIERMLTVFLGLKSLKETIAFPKNIDGTCSLTGAPNNIR